MVSYVTILPVGKALFPTHICLDFVPFPQEVEVNLRVRAKIVDLKPNEHAGGEADGGGSSGLAERGEAK